MTALQVEGSVYLTAVAYRRDGDHAGAVVDGINHPVITRPYTQIRPVAGQGCDTSRARIGSEPIDNLGDRLRTEGSSCRSERRARGRTSTV